MRTLLRFAPQDPHRRRPLRGSVIVVALRAPPFGQLLCPVRSCAAALWSLRSLRAAVRFAASSPRPPAAPFCPPPAGARQLIYLILPSLRSGMTTKVYRRVTAWRPPSSAFPRAALPGAWRKGWRDRQGICGRGDRLGNRAGRWERLGEAVQTYKSTTKSLCFFKP